MHMAGKCILYVENDSAHLSSLSEALKTRGYLVETASSKEEAVSALKRTCFDLLLVNMHLTQFRDHHGESVLKYALERYPQMPRVVITGSTPERPFLGTQQLAHLQGYFRRYKLAEFFKKEPGLDFRVFCDRIDQIIEQKGSTVPLDPQRWIRDKLYEIRPGANWDILSYLMRCNVLGDIFRGIIDYEDHLYILLSGSQPDERYVAAHHLWQGLWLKEGGLPYFDMIRLLIEREVDGTLYQGYRDHVVHSVITYLLGLYLYHGNSPIREGLDREFSQKTWDFSVAWKIAALFHDIGYVWNANPQHRQKVEEYFLERIQAYFQYPLHLYCDARGLSLSKREESHLRLKAKRYSRELNKLQDLRYSISDEYPLDQLDDIVRHTHLVPDSETGILERYDSFTKVTPPKGRDHPIEDHGVLSALLLICQFEYFEEYTQSICPLVADQPTISQETRATLRTLPLQVRQYALPVQHAAAAIALHNVSVDDWDLDDAKERPYYLTLDSYQLSLKHSPLAFLLTLADVLQCWDRPKRTFVPAALEDCTWQSQDVRILCREDKIELCFLQEPRHRRCTPDSLITKLSDEMRRYMNAEDLSMIVEMREP